MCPVIRGKLGQILAVLEEIHDPLVDGPLRRPSVSEEDVVDDAGREVVCGVAWAPKAICDVGVFLQDHLEGQIQRVPQHHVGITGQCGIMDTVKVTVCGERRLRRLRGLKVGQRDKQNKTSEEASRTCCSHPQR